MFTAQQSANLIVNLLKKQGTSIEKMLKECNLKPRIISNMKAGSMPSADKLAIIANYLRISVEVVLGLTDNPHPAITAPQGDK